jgi:cytochrome c peroxidase
MPSLEAYEPLPVEEAGCTELPADVAHGSCEKPGHDDPAVLEIMANFGKAIQAFTRRLTCGRSRFDDWIDGDAEALTADEQAGAVLFVTKGACNECHRGPYLTDTWFHGVGLGSRIARR